MLGSPARARFRQDAKSSGRGSWQPVASRLAAALAAATVVSGFLVVLAPTAGAQGTTWYAAPTAQGTGDCSSTANACPLQTALDDAASGDTIDLASGTYEDSDYSDDTSVTIAAEPDAFPTLVGTDSGTVLTVGSSASTTVTGVTVSGGEAQGISNSGTLTLDSSTVTNNNPDGGNGGGIYDSPTGTLTIDGCTISDNSADNGGGIYEDNNNNLSPGPTVTIEGSDIEDNSTTGSGGGIYNIFGSLQITNSTIDDNYADGTGGGMLSDGVVYLDSSTVSDNDAEGGGGGLTGGFGWIVDSTFAYNTSTASSDSGAGGGAILEGSVHMWVVSSTFIGNSADGGLGNTFYGQGVQGPPGQTGTIILAASIVAAGPSAQRVCAEICPDDRTGGARPAAVATEEAGTTECAGSVQDDGYNVDDDGSCDLTWTDGSVSASPAINDYLGTLADNGGPTETSALLFSPLTPTADPNPALAAVPGSFSVPVDFIPAITPCSLTDQRGALRPTSVCDIGAYEVTQPTSVTLTTSAPSIAPDGTVTYTATVSPVPSGGTVTFTDGTGNPATGDCASVAVTAGVATCTVSYAIPGSYQVSVSFSGTVGYTPSSTAAALTEDVNQAVLYASPSGDPDGSCVEEDPCPLQVALADSFSGNMIEVFGGTYTGNFVDDTSVTIEPVPGASPAVLDGGDSGTVLTIDQYAATTVEDLTIEDGGGTAIESTLSNSNVAANGGGVYNEGKLTLVESTVTDNTVSYVGGGIFNGPGADLTVLRSTISNNNSEIAAGIYNGRGTMLVDDSTIAGNDALDVGGIDNDGGNATIESSTVVGNGADTSDYPGGDLYSTPNATTVLAASIFAEGSKPECSGGYITDAGYNIDDDGSCGLSASNGSVPNSGEIDNYLGTLGSYGGPTKTVSLVSISPAETLDPALAAIPASFVLPDGKSACTGTDQRGIARQTGCDMGAFELDSTAVTLTTSAASVAPGQSVTYTATISPAPDGGTVAFSFIGGYATTQCPAQTVSNGVATCTVEYSAPGVRTVSATYSGDTDFAAATSQSLAQDVVTAVLYASPNGSDPVCTETDPCALSTAVNEASTGNTIELFGGTYLVASADTASVTIEPVPGTQAVVLEGLDGRALTIDPDVSTTLDDISVSGWEIPSKTAHPTTGLRGLLTPGEINIDGDGEGGIANYGKLVLVDSTVSSDQGDDGGGIYNDAEADLTLLDSTVSGNTSPFGGGVYNEGILLVKDSTIADNTASQNGGGIYNEAFNPDPAEATIEGSTLSGNTSAGGSGTGGAIWNSSNAATTTFADSIVATPGGAPAGGECGGTGTMVDAGYNVDDDGTCGLSSANGSVSDSHAIDDYLGALGSVGGPTQTIPLLPSSKPTTKTSDPALASVPDNQTLPDGTFSCAGTDQRGVTRRAPCDMGAFEQVKTEISLTASPGQVEPGGKVTYTATVSPLPEGGSVTFSDAAGAVSKSCSSVDVADTGVAICTVTYPAVGSYEVTASYAGNEDFASSGPSAVTVTVAQVGGKTATTTSLTSSTTTPSPGTPVTLTASVSPVPDGGTLSFLDEGKALPSCGAVPLSDGRASCRVVLAAGPHDVVATYAGNSALAPSNSPPVAIEVAVPTVGYWLTDTTGDVFAFGNAAFLGNLSSHHGQAPVVGMAAPPGGKGYWLVDSTGGVSAFGTAQPHGSLATGKASAPIVGISTTPDGGGYWLAAANGAVYAFGDAKSLGSMFGRHFTGPIVGIAATPDGQGYWLTAANGGVFAFGAAAFHGSMQSIHLTRPIVGIAPSVDGHGYFLVAGDGGVFAFGDAHFHGSLGRAQLLSPIVGLAPDYATGGYWIVTGHGSVYAFDAPFLGSLGDLAPVSRVAAIDAG
jgi:hypothetical protein